MLSERTVVLLEVEDTGPGFLPHECEALFSHTTAPDSQIEDELAECAL
jgi:hypothetical protein